MIDVRTANRLARTTGALFVALAVIGPFSLLYVPGRIVVEGDAAATAENMRSSGGLLRAGIVGEIAIMLVELAVPVLLYLLLRPVSRAVALTAAFARIGEAFVIGTGLIAYVLALRLVEGGADYAALDPAQREALALLSLDAHGDSVFVGQIFFGASLALLGWLVLRAAYLPGVLGVLLWVAAAGYLTDALGSLLWSGYADALGWLVGVTALVGEVPFFLWLLVKGVDRGRWPTGQHADGARPAGRTEAAAAR